MSGVRVWLMVKAGVLIAPLITGLVDTNLNTYLLLVVRETGNMPVKVPEVVLVSKPKVVNVVKLPCALESKTLKMFPLLKVPVTVYGILMLVPEQ